MMNPKVSIIIPVYNTSALLPRCLESVVSQSLCEIEIICIDDGSTDNSLEVLNSWAAKDSRIQVLTQPNGRQGKARNNGMNHARGEYIGMIDSDDYIPHEYFEQLYTAAVEADADIAMCGIIKEKKMMSRIVKEFTAKQCADEADEKLRLCSCPPDFHPVNKLYRRSMIERLKLRFAEGVQYEDVMFVMRAICESGKLVTVPHIAYRYVLNPTSTVKSKQTLAKQLQKYEAHHAMVRYALSRGINIAPQYRNITARHYSLCGVCIWKIKEQNNRRTLRLFDLIPIATWATK